MSSNIEIICEWIRIPDNAETFTAGDLVMWANDRPTGEALSLKREIEAKDALISELVGALEVADKTLDCVLLPKMSNILDWKIWAGVPDASVKAKAALTKAREHMK